MLTRKIVNWHAKSIDFDEQYFAFTVRSKKSEIQMPNKIDSAIFYYCRNVHCEIRKTGAPDILSRVNALTGSDCRFLTLQLSRYLSWCLYSLNLTWKKIHCTII